MGVSGIYAIVHMASGRQYVGHARSFSQRWAHHRYLLREGRHHCVHLQRAWDKYGAMAFDFRVVETMPDTARLVEREQAALDAAAAGLYNIARVAAAPMAGRKKSPESVARSRAAHLGSKRSLETRARIGAALRGRSRPPDVVARMRAAQLAAGVSVEGRAAIAASNRRRTFSADALERIAAAHRGRPKPETQKVKMRVAAIAQWQRKRAGSQVVA